MTPRMGGDVIFIYVGRGCCRTKQKNVHHLPHRHHDYDGYGGKLNQENGERALTYKRTDNYIDLVETSSTFGNQGDSNINKY